MLAAMLRKTVGSTERGRDPFEGILETTFACACRSAYGTRVRSSAVGLDLGRLTSAPSGRSVAFVTRALLERARASSEPTRLEVIDRAGHLLASVAAPI
jgi:hypothetical protein